MGREERLKGVDTTPKSGGVNSFLADAFVNDMDPRVTLHRETATHRIAVFMYLQCHSVKEVSARLDLNPKTVSNILRQPWARELMQKEIKKIGEDEVRKIIEMAGKDALMNVVDLAASAESEAVRLNANKEILDRLLGKAPQVVEHGGTVKLEELTDDQLAKHVNIPTGGTATS